MTMMTIPFSATVGTEYLSDEQLGTLFRGLMQFFRDGAIKKIDDDPMTDMLLHTLIASVGYDSAGTADQGENVFSETNSSFEPDTSYLDEPACFLRDLPETDATQTDTMYLTDSNKGRHLQESPSYQPVKKVRKSQRKCRVEEKESNKEKEERAKETEKEERKRPSSPPPSRSYDEEADALEEKLFEGINELELTEEEVFWLKELEKVTDIRDITDEDKKLWEKAGVTDRRFLTLLLETYNLYMTDMLPEYEITEKRLKIAKEIFEIWIEEELPLQNLFEKASESSFLCGKKGFRGADFDWIMREDRIRKILAGYYDDYC